MKYFRFLVTVLAMAVAMSVSAQSKTTSKTKSAPAKTAVKKSTTVKKTSAAPARTATTTAKKTSTTTTKKTVTTSKKQDYDSSVRVMFTTKVGSCYGHGGFGENITLEKKYCPYFAVDFFSIDYSAPFNFNYMNIGIKTGVRGFTPSFWNTSAGKICRGYSSLALGYDCALVKGSVGIIIPGAGTYVASGWGTTHGFAMSWGVGLEFVEKANFGYALEYDTNWKTTSHYFTIGVKF